MSRLLAVSVVVLALVAKATETQPEDCDAVATAHIASITTSAEQWDPKGLPVADKLYYVPSGKSIAIRKDKDGENYDFPGKLALAGSFLSVRNNTITWSELRLLSGSKYSWSSMSHLDGTVIVEAEDAARPALIEIFHPAGYNGLYLYADFSGAAGTSLVLARSGKPYLHAEYGQVANPDCPWNVSGDWSAFYGRCTVTNESCFKPTSATSFVLPGELVIQSNAWYWGVTMRGKTTTIGTLTLEDGANFWSSCNAANAVSLTEVTNKLTVGEARIEFVDDFTKTSKTDYRPCKTCSTLPQYAIGTPVVIPIFKLTGAAAETANLPDLSKATIPDYPNDKRIAGKYPLKKALVFVDNGDGTKTIAAKYYDDDEVKSFTLIKHSGSYKLEECPFNPESTAGVAAYWNPAEIPVDTDTGIISLGDKTIGSRSVMFLPNFSSLFTNMTFLVTGGGTFYLHGGHTAMERMICAGNVNFNSYGVTDPNTLTAPIDLTGGSSYKLNLSAFQAHLMVLEGPISGASSVCLVNPSPHSSPKGSVALYGDNTALAGAVTAEFKAQLETTYTDKGAVQYKKFPDVATDYVQTLIITNANALGGAYTGATAWKSLLLTCYTLLQVDETTAFVEPTRGLAVDWGAQIEVAAGKRFEVGVPVTYGGELIKRGAGVLTLSGAAHFVEEYGGSRGEGTNNVITVKAGALKIANAAAVNGVALVFSNETSRLLLDPVPTGALATTGFVATTLDEPFVSAAADGKVAVALDVEDPSFESLTVPICTVKTAVADASPLRLIRPKNFAATIERRNNGDGTVTLFAHYDRKGLIFLLQ